MQKLIFVIVIALAGFIWWRYENVSTEKIVSLPSPSPVNRSSRLAENEAGLTSLSTPQGVYRFAWEIVPKADEVRVGVNEKLEFSSQQLLDKFSCRVLTSAAFYDDQNRPLGLLMDKGATLSAWRSNLLLHGVVGKDKKTASLKIVKEMGETEWEWAVQAGPMVWQGGQAAEVRLAADQAARRIVAGITEEGQLVLITVVAADSLYGGPLLADLPQILDFWQRNGGVALRDALNWDGGTASAFLSPTLKLKELKPIGSYVCIK